MTQLSGFQLLKLFSLLLLFHQWKLREGPTKGFLLLQSITLQETGEKYSREVS